MPEAPKSPRRLCPTRTGGAHSLIAHLIEPSVCLERQRRLYHKCFSCEYRGLAADVILPTPVHAEPFPSLPEEPVPVPVRKKTSKAV